MSENNCKCGELADVDGQCVPCYFNGKADEADRLREENERLKDLLKELTGLAKHKRILTEHHESRLMSALTPPSAPATSESEK